MSVLIGIDIGGTFTDIVALNEDTGELKVTKVPSTPGEFSKGFLFPPAFPRKPPEFYPIH